MIGHLGTRVSALLDGQLSPEDTERAWEHVHACHACRDLVEREGWVKTRLAGLAQGQPAGPAPERLKGSLLGASALTPDRSFLTDDLALCGAGLRKRTVGIAVGGSAIGAAVMGVLALGVAPADAPTIDRRAPVTSITQPGNPQPTTLRAPVGPAAFWAASTSRRQGARP